jgi:hypothetical protein
MRVLMLVLMMVLLPVRGWAGEVMATEVAAAPVVAGSSSAGMPADCPMAKLGDGAGMTHATCASCAFCLPLLSSTFTPELGKMPLPQLTAPRDGAAFVSAEPAPGFKPPIS